MLDALKAILDADATLTGLLTGGVYAQTAVGEFSRQQTPAAFDSATAAMLPACLITAEADTPNDAFLTAADRTIAIFFYQLNAYDIIEPARERTVDLLHDTTPALPAAYVGADADIMFRMRYAGGVMRAFDDVLAARMTVARFTVLYARRTTCDPVRA